MSIILQGLPTFFIVSVQDENKNQTYMQCSFPNFKINFEPSGSDYMYFFYKMKYNIDILILFNQQLCAITFYRLLAKVNTYILDHFRIEPLKTKVLIFQIPI